MSALHHCNFCFRELPTLGGLKRHISSRRECHRKWEDTIAKKTETVSIFDTEEQEEETYHMLPEEPVMASLVDGPPGNCNSTFDSYIPAPVWEPSPDKEETEESNARASKRVRVEDVPDEDDISAGHFYTNYSCHPVATVQAQGKTVFERQHEEARAMQTSEYAPFSDEEEWQLAEWLMKHLGQNRIDEYLDLPIVSTLPVVCTL
ncbi:hypothetical protein SCP_1900310 [Sparassis crispa]|uniref:Uncharacterized protein n=1 Tax=Sparassis crispa TaxID=139825 RepID=A0A401H6Y9_9APHY|nr:hypothetical protein SCP_1900310 [Sparassis crispa]GBE90182.1 hypothetical protein SCP_1900310 [Sparassis crispa]